MSPNDNQDASTREFYQIAWAALRDDMQTATGLDMYRVVSRAHRLVEDMEQRDLLEEVNNGNKSSTKEKD